MVQRYGIPLIVASGFSLLFYLVMSWSVKLETEFKFKIRTEQRVFYTNSYTKSTDGCIQFLDRGENPATACGNYTIEQTRIK